MVGYYAFKSVNVYVSLHLSLFSLVIYCLKNKQTTPTKTNQVFVFVFVLWTFPVCVLLTASHGVGNLKAPFWRCCPSSWHASNIPVRGNCSKPPARDLQEAVAAPAQPWNHLATHQLDPGTRFVGRIKGQKEKNHALFCLCSWLQLKADYLLILSGSGRKAGALPYSYLERYLVFNGREGAIPDFPWILRRYLFQFQSKDFLQSSSLPPFPQPLGDWSRGGAV